MLINAGNAKKEYINCSLGTISLTFEDQTVQETELVLGKNICEWASGNMPGSLVDTATDPFYAQIISMLGYRPNS